MFKAIKKTLSAYIKNIAQAFNSEPTNQGIVKSGIGNLLINILNKFIVLISGVLLVRILGKDGYGIYSYILSLIYVLIIPAEFGISTLIVRDTAQGIAEKKFGLINGVWRWSLRVTLLLYAIVVGASVAIVMWGPGNFDPTVLTTFFWSLCLMPFQAIILLISAALRGMKRIIIGQLPDLIILPGLFIILFLIVYLVSPSSITTSSSMALRSISAMIAFIFSIIFFIKVTPKAILKTQPTYQRRHWFSSALPLGLSSGLGMVKSRITILLLGLFVSANQIGTFQIAISTAALAAIVLHANDATLAPQFASLYIQEKKQALQHLVTLNSRIVFAFNLMITMVFVVFGKALLAFVFGPELIEAYPSVLIMMVGQLINSLVGSVVYLLNMTGNENDVMKVIGFSSIINVVFTLILSPFWGIIGGAISTTVSLIFAQIIMSMLVRKRLGIVSHAFYKIPT